MEEMTDPIAFAVKSDVDTMYFHQSMQQPDKAGLIRSIIIEFNGHFKKKKCNLIPKEDVPEGEPVLESMWNMKRKRDINTRSVYKRKAMLNFHGGQQ